MSNCSPDKIVSALHEEAEIITDIVRQRIVNSDRLALRMVPDGGTVRRHANMNTVIYGEARQASVGYRQLDHAVRPLDRSGEMKGRSLQGSGGIFVTSVNDIDDNACNRGTVTIDFAEGFRIRQTSDFGLDLDTPIKCARDLDRLGEAHIRGYFDGFHNQFVRFGMDNFSDNLLNLCIQYSEANASVRAADEFNVTTGGWQAPPLHRISIHFLQDYRDHIMAEVKGRGMDIPEDWMLEVEMPRNDWIDAVIADQINRRGTGAGGVTNGIQTNMNDEWLRDTEGPMRGRQFAIYGGIKCFFNETPIRGYFVKTGTSGGNDTHRFVRVYDWVNTIDESGGLVTSVNHQYRQDTIYVDGVAHQMVTLIPHIDPRSFQRFGLIKPIKPFGTDNADVNYQVRVIDGARLGCNDFDDKFKFAARHEFRFKALYPEFSGFIAYLHGRRSGYVIDVVPRNYKAGDTAFASPEQLAIPGTDGCQTAECAQCGKIVGDEGQCASAPTGDSVVGLVPAGAVTIGFFGDAFTAKFRVDRTGDVSDTATVDYTTSGENDEATATSGTLTWLPGDTAPQYIEVPILATADDGDHFHLTLSNPVQCTIKTGANTLIATIDDLS